MAGSRWLTPRYPARVQTVDSWSGSYKVYYQVISHFSFFKQIVTHNSSVILRIIHGSPNRPTSRRSRSSWLAWRTGTCGGDGRGRTSSRPSHRPQRPVVVLQEQQQKRHRRRLRLHRPGTKASTRNTRKGTSTKTRTEIETRIEQSTSAREVVVMQTHPHPTTTHHPPAPAHRR